MHYHGLVIATHQAGATGSTFNVLPFYAYGLYFLSVFTTALNG